MFRKGKNIVSMLALCGISTVATASSTVNIEDRGVINVKDENGRSIWNAKAYLFGPKWKQMHVSKASNIKDEADGNSRKVSFDFEVPNNNGNLLNADLHITKNESGFSNTVSFSAGNDIKLQSACWSAFLNIKKIAGSKLEITTSWGKTITIDIPNDFSKSGLWAGKISKLKVIGPHPIEINIEPARKLVVQDMRKWNTSKIELRFNFADKKKIGADEVKSSRFDVKVAK